MGAAAGRDRDAPVPPDATVEFLAAPDDHGERLDRALAARPGVGSRARAEALVEGGRVEVDGRPRRKGHRLSAGEHVVARLDPTPDAGVSAAESGGADEMAAHDVVYEDEHVIVVDKPAGVVVHPAPGHPTGTLVQALAGRAAGGSDPTRPGIVHRLDRDTSGLILVARSADAHERLAQALRERAVGRDYVALVEGRPETASGTIEAPVGRDRRDPTLVSLHSDRPRTARTHFEVREALARTSLLDVRLDTGRTHQIRVHLSAIGHPVCGDQRYGGTACGAALGLRRQFLHAVRLHFVHPVHGTPVDVTSDLPEDLDRALAAARLSSPAAHDRADH